MTNTDREPDASAPAGSYAVVMVGFAFQLLVQLALQLLLAGMYGTSRPMDAYLFAMGLPISLSAILAGTLGPPVITTLGSERGDASRAAFVGMVLLAASGVSLLLAVLGLLFSVPLMNLLQPGLDLPMVLKTAGLFRILVWLVPANTLIGLLQAILNASLSFAVPAVAGVAGPAITVLIVWAWGEAGIETVAWATVAGAAVNVAIQFASVRRQIALPQAREAIERLQPLLVLAGPILAGMMFLKVDPLVDRFVTSNLDDGRMAQLQFAYRILTIFLMLASGTLSTVSFPRIARRAGSDDAGLVRETGNGLAVLITLCLPALAAMLLFSEPLVRDLFQRGRFTSRDTEIVAELLQFYAPMLIGAALGELSGKTLYALRDTMTPNLVGPSFLAIGFLLKLIYVPAGGALVLAGITSAVWVGAGLALLAVAVRRVGMGVMQPVAPSLLRSCVATAAASGVGAAVLQFPLPFPGLTGLLAGAAVYFGAMGLMGKQWRSFVLERLRRR